MTSWIDVLGWTLVHFAWQGALIGLAAAVSLRLLRAGSPQLRYAVACAALCAMLAAPLVTAHLLSAAAPPGTGSVLPPAAPAAPAAFGRMSPPAADASPLASTVDVQTLRLGIGRALPSIVALWLAGVVCLLVHLAGGWWRVRQLHRAALAAAPSTWDAAGARIADRLGLRRRVHVVDSRLVDTPAVLGWVRPVILLPIAALASLTPAQVEAVLAHELAHVRRHDFIANLLQAVTETLLFYHPAVWWISARIRTEREHCCDDVAVAVSGDAAGYAEALAELEAGRTGRARLALAATSGALVERVRRLLRMSIEHTPARTSAPMTVVLVLVFVAAAGGLRYMAALEAGQQPPGLAPAAWQIHETTHLDIYHPPQLDGLVGSVARMADRAYDQVSASLRHALASRPRLILFTTQAELDRALSSGAIPARDESRQVILLSADIPADRLDGEIVHELTHSFLFDILPLSADVPQWITEGVAERERGEWRPTDLELLARMVRADAVPRISRLARSASPANPRLHYSLGHAAFEFIESRWGKEGTRRFLFALRQNALGGSLDSAYTAALGTTPGEFDQAFETYLRDRFAAVR